MLWNFPPPPALSLHFLHIINLLQSLLPIAQNHICVTVLAIFRMQARQKETSQYDMCQMHLISKPGNKSLHAN